MTQSLEALTRRADSMRGIRSIVHTMKTLSVINAAPYEQAVQSIAAYHATVLDGMHAFISQSQTLEKPDRSATQEVMIVFGTDHGLCGGYNAGLADHVANVIGDAARASILCIGARLADALRGQNLTPETTLLPPASVDGIGKLAHQLTQQLDRLRHSIGHITVSLAFVARDESGGHLPKSTRLLPLDPALIAGLRTKPWISRSLPSFPVPSEALAEALIREHAFASVFRAAAEALMTENAARLALMQQAERAVDEGLFSLRSETRFLRQSEITTELLDMIVGFETLKKKRASPHSTN